MIEDKYVSYTALVSLLGEHDARRVVTLYGGRRVGIGQRPITTKRTLGQRIAEALASAFAGDRLLVDSAVNIRRRDLLRRLSDSGASPEDIAWLTGLSERTVCRHRSAILGSPLRRPD